MSENCVENNLPCCGCGVCAVSCPAGAIDIKLSKNGFYEAVLNPDKCVSCGVCLKVCPKFLSNSPKTNKFEDLPLYAAASTDQNRRLKSSSGAIAYEIALWGLSHGYKIAGVIYDIPAQSAKTVIADDKKGLEELRGSKYLQSHTFDAFAEIAKSKDKFIVFGAPCQCAALKMLSRQKNFEDRVIFVDFLCHGVPSVNLWRSTLKETLKKFNVTKADKIDFRSKKYGWGEYNISVSSDGKDTVLQERDNNFYTLFFSDLFLCEACYKCAAKKSFDFADIRLGDFWGLELEGAQQGLSAVTVISKTGLRITEDLKSGGSAFFIEQPHSICLREQACFKDTPFNAALRERLLGMLGEDKGTDNLVKEYFKALSFKKYMILKIKSILPSSLKKMVRKLYRSFK